MEETKMGVLITEKTAEICKSLVLAEISKCKSMNIYTDDFLAQLENSLEELSRERKVEYFRKLLERIKDVYGDWTFWNWQKN